MFVKSDTQIALLFAHVRNKYYLCTAKLQKISNTTKFKYKKMKKFFEESGLLVIEERAFRDRVINALGWSSDQWANRLSGRTALSSAERAVLSQELVKLRHLVASGALDLRAYNK